ncbi:MAG: ABC transporter ATP-binding protein [Anaerolineales bacterium]|nr:ABC transporter ATP-binding protein [Anaerolineales bacterium]
MNGDNVVETQDLSKRFGSFTAVNNVNFFIPRGEIFGLLGPNGAGKTTTIRMLCGILNPSGGSASVLGYDIQREAEQIKRQIGYMSQKFALYNDLTPRENLFFYASIYGVPPAVRPKKVKELITMAGLDKHENELTRNLSGAWRQRLALACAIAHDPPMLFLDEATAGVDPVSRRAFWDLIYEMAGRGVTILATTHYMDEAEYCNTVGLMYQARLIAVSSPDTLRDNLQGTLVEIDCDQPLKALGRAKSIPGVLEVSLHGVYIHAAVKDEKALKRLFDVLDKDGITVHSHEQIIPSLEDVFISMVQEQVREQELAAPPTVSA